MLELFHTQDLLKHIVQLLLRQNKLTVERLLHARRTLRIFIARSLQYAIEFRHPRRQHRFFAETIDFRQRSVQSLKFEMQCWKRDDISGRELTSRVSRCYCGTPRENRAWSKHPTQPFLSRAPTSRTRHDTTAQHSETLRQP